MNPIPNLALRRLSATPNWSARTGIVGQAYAGFTAATDTTITFTLSATYWGSYGVPETQSQQGQGTYKVVIDATGGKLGQVLSITEPTYTVQ